MPLQIQTMLGIAVFQWILVFAMTLHVYRVFKKSSAIHPKGLMFTKVATVLAGSIASGGAVSLLCLHVFWPISAAIAGCLLVSFWLRFD